MKRTIWIVLGWLMLSLNAHSASFDCAKAGTKVEKLICADATLSKLDEELSAAYKAALKDQTQGDSIKQAQKKWMKERNGCADAACVKRAYEVRLQRLSPASTHSLANEIPQQFLHRWTGYSRAIYSIYGDLNVSNNKLMFENIGKHSFAVISTFEDSVVLEMAKTFQDCGRYVRLGPMVIKKSSDSLNSLFVGDMNFSVYATKEAALTPMQFDTGQRPEESCSWGLYSRTASDETP